MRATYAVFDPRCGDDFRLDGLGMESDEDAVFSSLQDDILVVHGARFDWRHVEKQLEGLFEASGTQGLLMYRPWWPKVVDKIQVFAGEFGPSSDAFTQLRLDLCVRGICTSAFAVRDRLGGESAGLWILASSRESTAVKTLFSPPVPNDVPPIFTAARIAKAGATALALDEGAQSTLFVPVASHVQSSIADLLDALQNTGFEKRQTIES